MLFKNGAFVFNDAKVLIYFYIRKFYHTFLSKYFEISAFFFQNLEFSTTFPVKITSYTRCFGVEFPDARLLCSVCINLSANSLILVQIHIYAVVPSE